MSLLIGIRNSIILTTAQSVNASTALVVMGANTAGNEFQFNLGANKRAKIIGCIPFTLGATGGYKFQIVGSQSFGSFVNTYIVEDTVTPAQIVGYQNASAAFANALAVAGNHFLNFNCTVKMGSTAGIVSLQFACNSAANGITANEGATMDVTFL